jgi:hypothetical protein
MPRRVTIDHGPHRGTLNRLRRALLRAWRQGDTNQIDRINGEFKTVLQKLRIPRQLSDAQIHDRHLSHVRAGLASAAKRAAIRNERYERWLQHR